MPNSLDAVSAPPLPGPVVLGSGSSYRRELLSRILPAFEVVVPGVDESPLPGEPPADMATRLAARKCAAVALLRPDAIVIGSDQVAECAGLALGKPGTVERAIDQLTRCAGQVLVLHTAVCIRPPAGSGPPLSHLDQTRIRFRDLGRDEIERYVMRDRPLDCAGSFRCEGLGPALFAAIETSDPTGIQGLPLVWVAAALRRLGLAVP